MALMWPETRYIPAVFPSVSNKIALVGEAGGAEEEASGLPFQGQAGKLLNRMLERVGVKRNECLVTNVFKFKPKDNNLRNWAIPKDKLPLGYKHPSFGKSLYIEPEFLERSLDKLTEELIEFNPSIIVALGQTALTALTKITKLKNYRGVVLESSLLASSLVESKVIATYHPAGIMRKWKLLPIGLIDLAKARRESKRTKPITERKVFITESLYDVHRLEMGLCLGPEKLCFDVETMGDFITSIGFSHKKEEAFVIPFYHKGKLWLKESLWWKSIEEELMVWKAVRTILQTNIPKVTQNGIFDVQRLMTYGIEVKNLIHDTMLFYHAYQPEMPKDLGFLGSVYTDMGAWKQLRETGLLTDED